MKIKIFQVDAFTSKLFSGNPAAVCPLSEWVDDVILQNIAAENNLAETAFYVRAKNGFHIRWFTPKAEVKLCGHATLASAFVLYNFYNYKEDAIHFESKSGILKVTKKENFLILNFPPDKIKKIESTEALAVCFDKTPVEIYEGATDYMFIYSNENDIQHLKPNFSNIEKLNARGIIATAKGNNSDYVLRFFAPSVGVNEDPATGSAQTTLVPYWCRRFNKTELTGIQLSERTGSFKCSLVNDRVEISGQVIFYLEGEISI
jgi:PhzF family phenazine biosynthesis protein